MRLLWIPLLLLLFFLGCGQEKKSKAPASDTRDNFIEREQFANPVELLTAPEETGVYVLTENAAYLWENKQKSLWINFGPRSVWSMAFSPRWQWDRLFYAFYENQVGASILSEGAESGSGGELRRKVLQLPASEGGSLSWERENLVFGDRQRLLRIKPFLLRGVPYSVPRGNPRGEEVWAALPSGRWSASELEGERVVWGEQDDRAFLWQGPGSVLRTKDADWKGRCALVGGVPWQGGLLFAESCSGDLLLWKSKKMETYASDQPRAIDILLQDDSLFILTPKGRLLEGEVPR